ncbi:MAG TPA: alpha/beta hydrolase [Thermoleophilaceae bacterium]|nr:alpha/beta hydrolase [Thermoleophilaceae bacterium]
MALLPGWGGRSSWWEPVLEAMSGPPRRALLFDLLGHGASAAPRDGYSVERQADLVARELEERDASPVLLVGHSLGGLIGTALAARAPEHVAGLVLIDVPPSLEHQRMSLLGRLSLMPVVGTASWRLAPDAMMAYGMKLVVAPGYSIPRQVVRESRAMSHRSARLAAAAFEDYVTRVDVVEVLREAGKPTLVLWGEEEQYFPVAAAYEFESVAEIVTIPGAGHTAYLEKPEEVARAVDRFAAELAAPTTHD